MKQFANIVSVLFHPLLMMTYGVLLALTCTYMAIYPLAFKLYVIGIVTLFTVVIPSAVVIMLVRRGRAGDMELTQKHERHLPYLVFMGGNLCCFILFYKMQMPSWLLSIFIGVSFALLIALCINFVWKISAHTMGIGGIMGAVMGIAYLQQINPYSFFILIILLSGLTCTARLILGKHTLMQVFCGLALGFSCTFAATLLNISFLLIQ